MSNTTTNRGQGPDPNSMKKLLGLQVGDILYFHSRGAHGNYEMDSTRFNPDLHRADCPKCQEREHRYNAGVSSSVLSNGDS